MLGVEIPRDRTFLAPSSGEQTRNYDIECSNDETELWQDKMVSHMYANLPRNGIVNTNPLS